jgi:hypothetical protein
MNYKDIAKHYTSPDISLLNIYRFHNLKYIRNDQTRAIYSSLKVRYFGQFMTRREIDMARRRVEYTISSDLTTQRILRLNP